MIIDQKAVRLIADLCLDYEIFDGGIWTSILEQMGHLGMVQDLATILQQLSGIPSLWHIPSLEKAWRRLLQFPDVGKSEASMSICLETIEFLMRYVHAC